MIQQFIRKSILYNLLGFTILFGQSYPFLHPSIIIFSSTLFFLVGSHMNFSNIHTETLWGGVYWVLWITYSLMWREPYGAFTGFITGILFTGIGLISSLQLKNTSFIPFILFQVGLLFPSRGNLIVFMDPWDGFLHVFIYLCTYYFQYYTVLFLEWDFHLLQHILGSIWVLFVTKWFIPFIGIQWMYYAYELSGKLSRNPKANEVVHSSDEEKQLIRKEEPASVDQAPPPLPTKSVYWGAKKVQRKYLPRSKRELSKLKQMSVSIDEL